MSAVIAAFPTPPVAATDNAASILPAELLDVFAGGETIRRSCFSEAGFDGVREDWRPPARITPPQAALARRALEDLRRNRLAPAAPNHLLARVLALLSHYPAKGLSPEVEQMVALDWADDLGEFPAWAIDQAARIWRRTRKWRPSIAEMRALCLDACRAERQLAERLALIAGRASSMAPVASPAGMGALRRMP